MNRTSSAGLTTLTFAVSIGLLAGPVSSQDVGPTGPIPYDIVEGWAKPFAGEGFAFGGNSGVYAESPDRIIALQRGETRLPDPVPAEFNEVHKSSGTTQSTQLRDNHLSAATKNRVQCV